MTKPKITLYVDIVSPFAYFAFYILRNSPAFKECEVSYVPIFLGGLMQATGNKAPIAVKNKDRWINAERMRWAKYFNIPVSKHAPRGFPINTLPIQRVLTSLSLSHPQSVESAIALFYENFWVHYNEPAKPENTLAIIRTIVGSDEEAQKVLDGAKEEDVKKALAANTDKAFKDGAFGLPWFAATNAKGEKEGFWGIDHIGQLCDFVGVERPAAGKGWRSLL